ncbi:hypothetical protein SDC9_150685 [bioreactor metagenome]|uniref:Uncharacterized protein n=1 Tax=bioreactor metagenome TaxID=1076179 RepID=A0A645EN59_9ZZZZ
MHTSGTIEEDEQKIGIGINGNESRACNVVLSEIPILNNPLLISFVELMKRNRIDILPLIAQLDSLQGNLEFGRGDGCNKASVILVIGRYQGIGLL